MEIILSSAASMEKMFDRLWPLMRSISGHGVRQTLDILREIIPLSHIEIPSGTQVFDWKTPKEWRFNEAYIIAPNGARILDAHENNLHLVNYSSPFKGTLSLAELQPHLHSLSDRPASIPYITSYYKEQWGFCLSQEMRDCLPEGDYQVVVDTHHFDGFISLGEALLPGEEEQEILFSTYVCHPSLANNELSGPLVTANLYAALAALPKRRFTYRFAFLVETIGAIAYLARYGEHFRINLNAGYIVTCVGTNARYTYKCSRQGNALGDRAAIHLLHHRERNNHSVMAFNPADGSDERQYCSPGFNLPIGSLMRTRYNTYPEYHTSEDNKAFISFEAMRETVNTYFDLCMVLENNVVYENTVKYGEPQLGRRGLYNTLGTAESLSDYQSALMWLLNLADGTHDLLGIAEKSGYGIGLLSEVAKRAVEAGVIKQVGKL